MRRGVLIAATFAFLLIAGPAWACGGLVAPGGAVRLLRTTTLSAYVDGVEHYVTSFGFAGAKGQFGSIVPLPGVPTDVEKGGRWTLQRLLQEVQPPAVALADAEAAAPQAARVDVLQRHRVGALDILILKGGGADVAAWAGEHGFALSADAPEVLEFYSRRSPIFAAARFDAERAARRGLREGDGTPIHFTIPTDDPWIPLRILGLAKPADEVVEADLFMLTEAEPATLPVAVPGFLADVAVPDGLRLARSEPASEELLADLRSDRGMGWLPATGMWLTYIRLSEEAGELTYDLATDVTGGSPSPVDAGFEVPAPAGTSFPVWPVLVGLAALLGGSAIAGRRVRVPA
ncbi:MAG TPA: DUF2330 domain-containing protein [Actinomycetota bacterium]|nr:DUF2330 domain-containing protein [Actinomycetota bacterium]